MRTFTKLVILVTLLAYAALTIAAINRVRVVNKTKQTVYIHVGGYSVSTAIHAGQWKIFNYPFKVIPPGTNKEINSSVLVATAGGRWMTTPNGLTFLSKPSLLLCINYNSAHHAHKTGDRVWVIDRAHARDNSCKLIGYRQPWFEPINHKTRPLTESQ